MDDTRKPLLYILGPVLGAILLLWTINLGVNQLRHAQEEIKQAARQSERCKRSSLRTKPSQRSPQQKPSPRPNRSRAQKR